MWIKQEAFFKLLGITFLVTLEMGTSKSILFLAKQEGVCISVVSKKYAYSLDSLHLHCIFDMK